MASYPQDTIKIYARLAHNTFAITFLPPIWPHALRSVPRRLMPSEAVARGLPSPLPSSVPQRRSDRALPFELHSASVRRICRRLEWPTKRTTVPEYSSFHLPKWLGRLCPKSGPIRAKLGGVQAKLGQFGRARANFGRSRVNLDKFARVRSATSVCIPRNCTAPAPER